jgi:hypothetical protein
MAGKLRIFALLCLAAACVLAVVLYRAGRPPAPDAGPMRVVLPAATEGVPAALPDRVYFRYTGPGDRHGQLAYIDTGADAQVRFVPGLSCEVAYIAAGRGICLSARRGVLTTYAAELFDATTFRTLASLPLQGVPSRTRLSADGRMAAATVFLTGHSYSSVDFSTQTLLIDVAGGRAITDLETFSVRKDGAAFVRPDFNFWGVTFVPGSALFYATLSTGGQHYLIRGDIGRRAAQVVHENVECPSLSPDGTRVAYKKRFRESGRMVWQLQVLDMSSGRETPLSERRSIDDQLEWLDARHVLYSVPGPAGASGGTEVWVVAADGSGAPRLFLPQAYSPVAVR